METPPPLPDQRPVQGKRPWLGGTTWLRVVVIAAVTLGIVAIVARIILAFVPVTGGLVEKARQTACLANLHAAGIEAMQAAADHDGFLPAQFPRPADSGPGDPGDPGKKCTYFYLAPAVRVREVAQMEETIIACDLTVSHPGTRNVLYLNGVVLSLTEAAFEQSLAKPANAAFAAAYHKAQRR